MKNRTQYLKWGLTAFLTVCAVLVFYDTFYMGGTLQQFVSKLTSVLAPVVYLSLIHIYVIGCLLKLKMKTVFKS